MRRNIDRRLRALEEGLTASASPAHVSAQAIETFRATGVLPISPHLARAVLTAAIQPVPPLHPPPGFDPKLAAYLDAVEEAYSPSPRLRLFGEACSPEPFLRDPARFVIRALVHAGGDVCDREFVPRDIDEWPGFPIGMQLLGFPDCLLVEPHEERARDVFERLDRLRERLPEDDPRWGARLAAGLVDYLRGGWAPADEFERECVLAIAELLNLATTALCPTEPSS